jgi:hypothetical protein
MKIVHYDIATGAILALYDSDIRPAPDPAEGAAALAVSEAEWAEIGPGWTAPDGVPTPPGAPSLADVQAAQIATLRAACEAEIVGGYLSSALGDPHSYPSMVLDQQNMIASVTASLLPGLAADWFTPFWCKNAAGDWAFARHTAAQIQQAGKDGKAAVVAAQARLAVLSAQVAAAETAEAVRAITWDSAP